ncbi:Hypothetical protein CpOVI2C_01406 [Corynebacterium pseudotuberculosis]|nr:Hypothetical protein Cp3995_1247 [Corynebacterium pseudotuberculosis 3/99-5]AIG12076.1 hypothetical protein CPTC_01788 [Corynebacterium pseudotuberculosis]AKC73982.1 Hypothetical protein Cp226_1263 [Corynebacterium pseudotuberculosis]AQL51338.1 hypothetical protein CpPA04_1239 [Corynebacterium pseudotuberculosis]ATQ65560.1 Hypothetical protein CpPA07_1256 [Corynebacterium pseudotuberculosis]
MEAVLCITEKLLYTGKEENLTVIHWWGFSRHDALSNQEQPR